MKIVTNTIPLMSPLTGVGKYTYNLVYGLQEQRPDYQFWYYNGHYFSKNYSSYSARFYRIKEMLKKIPLATQCVRLIRGKLPLIQWRTFDLHFEPNFIPQKIRAKRTAVAIHDFSFLHHPEWHPKDRIEYFSKHFFKRIGKADVIITMSDFIAKEAAEIIKPKGTDIISIHEGFDGSVFNPNGTAVTGYNKDGKYILYVGSIEPRKNLLNLLKAYLMLPENVRDEYKLLLVGFKGWHNAKVMELIERVKSHVEYLGYVSDDELANLYRNASCFVFPSLYEGFGLPPLEAMACGCPVIVSDKGSLPEVCGDAALYTDPLNPESIADQMLKVLTDTELKANLSSKGIDRASGFSWQKTVAEHLKVFEKISG